VTFDTKINMPEAANLDIMVAENVKQAFVLLIGV
jgi:hypothetical protein